MIVSQQLHGSARLLFTMAAASLLAAAAHWAQAQPVQATPTAEITQTTQTTQTPQTNAEAPQDEVFPESELQDGKRTSQAECVASRHAVWVAVADGNVCIRYFPSSRIEGSKTAAFYFHGDRLDGQVVTPGSYRDNKASVLIKTAENQSKVQRVPHIFVARPGVYGSSGWHRERRHLNEYLALNAAVDAIKARHGIEQVHLVGQSGGGTAVAALLTLGRTDVHCAVASSGAFDLMGRAQEMASRKGMNWNGCDTGIVCKPYNVTDHVAKVPTSSQRRFFVVGDPEDLNTAFRFQKAFADKLAAAGHAVQLLAAQALGPQHHALSHMANRVMGWCNAGFDDAKIAGLVKANALGLGAAVPTKPVDPK